MTGGGAAYDKNNRSDGLEVQQFEGSLRPHQDAGELHQSNLPQRGAAETQPQETSLQVLSSLIGADRLQREPDAAVALCRLMHNHPLGVELAGRYLAHELSTSVQALVEKVAEKSLLHEGNENAGSGVQALLDVTWEKLDRETQVLARLIGRFPEGTPVLGRWIDGMKQIQAEDNPELGEYNPETLKKSIEQLLALGLLKHHQEEEYLVHPLTRQLFRDKVSDVEKEVYTA